jgi:hypothetical protein
MILVATACAAAGCGGGKSSSSGGSQGAIATVDAPQWTTNVCDAVGGWLTSWKSALAVIQANPNAANLSFAQKKALIVKVFGTIADGTKTFADKLQSAGEPGISGGAAFAASQRKAAQALATTLANLESRIQGMSEADMQTNAQTLLSSTSTDVTNELTQIFDGLGKSAPAAVTAAFNSDPKCKAALQVATTLNGG